MHDVVIIGGGAVALSAALAGAAQGLSCRLISQVNSSHDKKAKDKTNKLSSARYYAVSPSNLKFFEKLGVALSTHSVSQFMLISGGRKFPLSASDSSSLCALINESDLLAALQARCKQSGIAMQSAKLLQWQGNTLKADDESIAAKLWVAADGARSPLSSQLHINNRIVDYQQVAIVANVQCAQLQNNTAYQWFFDNEVIALLPLGENQFSLIWSVASSSAPQDEEMIPALITRTQIDDLHMAAGNEVSRFGLYAQQRAARAAGNVVVIGDAARSLHPMAGQGLNQGLADVQSLFLCLRGCAPRSLPLAAAAYAGLRAPQAEVLNGVMSVLLKGGEGLRQAMLSATQLPLVRAAALAFAR